jgi:hypothetical protein
VTFLYDALLSFFVDDDSVLPDLDSAALESVLTLLLVEDVEAELLELSLAALLL